MADEKKTDMGMINCTQDCSSCPSSCDADPGESGPGFFERLESISESFDAIGEDNLIHMLNEAVAELEKEDAEAAGTGEAPHKKEIEEAAREAAKLESEEEAAEREAEKELGFDVEEVMEETGEK